MNKKNSSRAQLITIQKKIHKNLLSEANLRLGKSNTEIRKYEKAYKKDLSQKAIYTNKKALLEAIEKSQIIFIADYHPFPQSQRTVYRIFREVLSKKYTWILGLECFTSQDQPHIDQWLSSKITTQTLLTKTNYYENWGFSFWQNYSVLMDFAKENKIKIIGLNQPTSISAWNQKRSSATLRNSKELNDLEQRDRWAAGILTDLFCSKDDKPKKCIAVYGELHVARDHLPKQIEKVSNQYFGSPLKSITIHQNDDKLYWKLAKNGKEHQTSVFKLNKNTFCIVSSPPWAKVQSLLDWLEGGVEIEKSQILKKNTMRQKISLAKNTDFFSDEDHLDEMMDSAFEWQNQLPSIMKALCTFLQIARPPRLESIQLIGGQEVNRIVELAKRRELSASEKKLCLDLAKLNERFYHPATRLLYLDFPSPNAIVEGIGYLIFRRYHHSLDFEIHTSESFYRSVLENSFAFFASLLLNPKRKCDFTSDHKERLKLIEAGDPLSYPQEGIVRELTLHLVQKLFQRQTPDLSKFFKRSHEIQLILFLCSRNIGYLLAKRVHLLFQKKSNSIELIRNLYLSSKPNEWRFRLLIEHTQEFKLKGSKKDLF